MTSKELREKFIKFFEEKGHKVLPSSSLVPENDPSVLFTTAGMHPLVPFLMGEKHPLGKKLINVQKCLRTGDIDEVGDVQHLTFFEMLGYWSLGDYFKKESIKYTFGFYTEVLGFAKEDIFVSVFKGDDDAPFDEESYNTWKDEIGIAEEKIYKYDKNENWWGPVSDTGPCGPCTEMFVDTGRDECGPNCGPSCNCDKFVEIGNNVFLEYFKNKEGLFEKLEQRNVDVGLGFERLVMFVQNKKTVYETDLFAGIIKKIKELSKKEDENSIRIVADHLRAATFALADKVEPSNIERGYIVRRLIRRAIRHGRNLGIEGYFTSKIAEEVIKKMSDIYVELKQNEQFIYAELDKEEGKFAKALERGLKELEKTFSSSEKKLPGRIMFELYTTYGFPFEMIEEEAERRGFVITQDAMEEAKTLSIKHQEISRKGAEKKFKGGLASGGLMETKYHTTSHLLHQALKIVLGDHVKQAGSNITPERMRFDFIHKEKMTPEEIIEVEKIVNDEIKKGIEIKCEEMTLDEAKRSGAIGVFNHKYGDKVKVYTIFDPSTSSGPPFSREICGGPHVKNTSELGVFKINKEESSSQGVRRIKAILE